MILSRDVAAIRHSEISSISRRIELSISVGVYQLRNTQVNAAPCLCAQNPVLQRGLKLCAAPLAVVSAARQLCLLSKKADLQLALCWTFERATTKAHASGCMRMVLVRCVGGKTRALCEWDQTMGRTLSVRQYWSALSDRKPLRGQHTKQNSRDRDMMRAHSQWNESARGLAPAPAMVLRVCVVCVPDPACDA